MFLQEDDYKVQIRDMELDELTGYSEALRLESEQRAQEEMESYLRDRFDVAVIFEATGDDRSKLVVVYMIDIALYHLFAAIAPRNVPQIRVDRYDAAISWLMKVADGRLNPGLPPVEDADGNTPGTSMWGGMDMDGINW